MNILSEHNIHLEQTQETMALPKILALGNRQIEEGKVQPAADAVKRLRERRELRDAVLGFVDRRCGA